MQLWALVYARVTQTDGAAWRNLLLTRTQLFAPHQLNDPDGEGQRILYGEGLIALSTLADTLLRLGLPPDSPLPVLALEMFADPPEADPLGNRLGQARILRTSPLAPVPEACGRPWLSTIHIALKEASTSAGSWPVFALPQLLGPCYGRRGPTCSTQIAEAGTQTPQKSSSGP